MTKLMQFYSEYGEDQFLWSNYEDYFRKPRFYVDTGCGSAIHGSNTAWLRGLGWSGLHIDGSSHWEREWGGNFIHAVIHTDPRVRFTEVEGAHVLSRVEEGEPNVETQRLDEILFANRVDKVSFLSIDVEGQEIEVIKSMSLFPPQLWPPFIISEYRTAGIGTDYRVRDFVLQLGYKVIHETYANLIYLHEGYLASAFEDDDRRRRNLGVG